MNTRACNAVLDNDYRCNKTHQLHEVYLRDPYNHQDSIFISICRFCYDRLTKELNERTIEFSRKLSNLMYEMTKQRQAAKEYAMPFNNETLQMRIEDLRTLLKRISSLECRNQFCRKLLTTLSQDEKIYTASTFKPNGRRHFTYNYCSLKCFKTIKGKCGVFEINQTRQKILV